MTKDGIVYRHVDTTHGNVTVRMVYNTPILDVNGQVLGENASAALASFFLHLGDAAEELWPGIESEEEEA